MNKGRKGNFHPVQRQLSSVKPTVSVVIPCYNYARYLPGAVRSAVTQQGVTTQIIIVDDASTDDSHAVARALESQYPQVKVLANKVNRGPVHTFNHGLDHATGEYLVRLDADDLLTPGSLRRSVDVCAAHPEVGLVYGHPLHFTGEARRAARQRATGWSLWDGLTWVEDRCRTGVNVITSPEVLMRMSVVHQVGGQRDLPHGHDMEMWMRLATVSDVAYIRGVDQAWHRDHEQSLSARKVDVATDLGERWQVFATLFDGVDQDNARLREMRALAENTLVAEGMRALQVELQLGLPDHGRFNALAAVVERMTLDAEHRSLLYALRSAALNQADSLSREVTTFFKRVGRRLTREYRQRHWDSYGVY